MTAQQSHVAPPPADDVPAVVLISASWAEPSRPAPTVLTELSRRWGSSAHTLLVEDPDDDLLDQWDVQMLPTWMRFTPRALLDDESGLCVAQLTGTGPRGEPLVLEGPWTLSHRRSGALPKHVVDADFGPNT